MPEGAVPRWKVIHSRITGDTIARFDRSKYPGWSVPKDVIMSAIRRYYSSHPVAQSELMAKKKHYVKRAASHVAGAARRHFSSRGGFRGIMGSFKPMLDGGIAQIAASLGNKYLGTWGGIAGLAGTGYFMKNDTLMTIAGMHAAAQFPVASLLGGGSSGSTSGAV
jgi:hypothetical protein